jgi:hypothetical protein
MATEAAAPARNLPGIFYSFSCGRCRRAINFLISEEVCAMRIQFKTEGGFAYIPGLNKPVTIDLDE